MAELTSERSTQLARRNKALYEGCMTSGGERYQAQAFLNSRYYEGEHWTPEELDALGDRPALTLNLVFKLVNTIVGLYLDSSYSFRVQPRELDADSERTLAMNAVLKYVMDTAGYKYIEQAMVLDGVIQNRGYIDMDISFDESMSGNVVFSDEDPLDILPEPGAKSYDPEKWGYYLKLQWVKLSAIEQAYGKKARKKVEDTIASEQQDWGRGGRGAPRNKFAGPDDQFIFTEMYYNAGDPENPDWRVRVIELNEKILENRWQLIDPVTGDIEVLPVGINRAQAEQRANDIGVDLARQQVMTVSQVISAGSEVTLYEGAHSRPFYTLTPFFPFFHRGSTPGIVNNVISPTDMVNKTASQELHIVNNTANSGWDIEEGSLVNLDVEDLEDVGSQTGLNIEYARGSTPPKKRQPNDVPRGIDNLVQVALGMIDQISGIRDMDLTQLNSEPAVAAALKQAAIPYAIMGENLERTREILGRKLVWYVQHYYKEPRLLRIKETSEHGQETEKEMSVNVNDATDLTKGRYDIKIDATAGYEADKDSIFNQLTVMREKLGIAVPDNMLIKYSSVPDKDELALAVKKASQPDPEQQAMQKRASELEFMEKEAEIEKLRVDTLHRYSEIGRHSAQVAEMLAANPLSSLIAEQVQKGAYTAPQDSKQIESENANRIALQEQMKQQLAAGVPQRPQPGAQPGAAMGALPGALPEEAM